MAVLLLLRLSTVAVYDNCCVRDVKRSEVIVAGKRTRQKGPDLASVLCLLDTLAT
jgi:hypothetical protein